MTDVHSKQQRSYNMSQIKGQNTKPELSVRSILHRRGYRYKLHAKDLPGKPDIVLPKHRKVIEVNGCFWHMHNCKHGKVKPASHADFWQDKRMKTVERDRRNHAKLRSLGWQLLIVWECQCKDPQELENMLMAFMEENKST